MKKSHRRQTRKDVPLLSGTDAQRTKCEETCACQFDLCDPLDNLAASVPGVICTFRLRPDGTTVMPYASPAIFDLYGIRPEEVADDTGPIFSRIPPDDAKRMTISVTESALAMTQWHDEWRFDHPLKGERWIEGRSMPVREPDGSVLWHGYLHDVTERKERERHITELNAFLRLLTDAVPALISYVDADLRYRMVNRDYERWFGHPAKEIEGRAVQDVLGNEAWEKISPNMRRALAGESVEYEAELPYKDASGYVTKDADMRVLLNAVRTVAGGGHFMEARLADALLFERVDSNEPPPPPCLPNAKERFLSVLPPPSVLQRSPSAWVAAPRPSACTSRA